MNEEIKEVMAEVFKIDKDSISDDIRKFEFEKWDSLAHISLVAALEDHFDVVFDVDEIMEISTIEEIENLIKKYK